MRAVVMQEAGGPEVLRAEELPDPRPGEGEVLVRVEAIGVNHIDLVSRAGGAGPLPAVLGSDAAGRREDTGERVLVTHADGISLAADGKLKPVIDRELPLDQAADAHRAIEARETFGKVILRP